MSVTRGDYRDGEYPFTTRRLVYDGEAVWAEVVLAKDSKRNLVLYRCLGSDVSPVWYSAGDKRGRVWDEAPEEDASRFPPEWKCSRRQLKMWGDIHAKQKAGT